MSEIHFDSTNPIIFTIPHSGEQVPPQASWLKNLPEPILMCDVDRFVDVLYMPVIQELKAPYVKTKWHRYAADLNRVPDDIDESSVIGSHNPSGKHNRGFHWVVTTQNYKLMENPIEESVHKELVKLIYEPFHLNIRDAYKKYKEMGVKNIFHVDLHSMPSRGTKMHKDPGEDRADIVVSDCEGKSCKSEFKDLVIRSYQEAGFKVAYNWPYVGGRVTEQYGNPSRGQQAIQVELNRKLYMDEVTKKLKPELLEALQKKLSFAIRNIHKFCKSTV